MEDKGETTDLNARTEVHMSANEMKAQEVLDKLDQKAFGFFHVKMIVVSKDIFDLLFASSIITLAMILSFIYY